jgi:hypothetical protein
VRDRARRPLRDAPSPFVDQAVVRDGEHPTSNRGGVVTTIPKPNHRDENVAE